MDKLRGEDLMLNDIISVDYKYPSKVTTLSLCGLIETNIITDDNEKTYFSPMMLSGGFLEQNGFKRICGHHYELQIKDGRHTNKVVCLEDISCWNIHITGEIGEIDFQCCDIHTLQQAMRVVGLKDIANNFRHELEQTI